MITSHEKKMYFLCYTPIYTNYTVIYYKQKIFLFSTPSSHFQQLIPLLNLKFCSQNYMLKKKMFCAKIHQLYCNILQPEHIFKEHPFWLFSACKNTPDPKFWCTFPPSNPQVTNRLDYLAAAEVGSK